MSENEKTNATSEAKKKLVINVVKNRDLVEILSSPKLTGKLLLTIFLLVVFLFGGLSIVVISVKRLFPYNAITTTPYGATLIEDEDKTVAYWLFNTASLWADSGIEVSENDVLTIRASGSMHTAIHHLVSDAANNIKLHDPWMDTDGGREPAERNPKRENYRLAPQVDENVLLMRINANPDNVSLQVDTNEIDRSSIYVIGKERVNLTVRERGYLQFAVNDIMMTPQCIRKMYKEELDAYKDYLHDSLFQKALRNYTQSKYGEELNINRLCQEWENYYKDFFGHGKDGTIFYYDRFRDNRRDDTALVQIFKEPFTGSKKKYKELSRFIEHCHSELIENGGSPQEYKKRKKWKDNPYLQLDDFIRNHGLQARPTTFNEMEAYFPVFNEYNYYYATDFKDAWYVDNVGSFLIVIEKRKQH